MQGLEVLGYWRLDAAFTAPASDASTTAGFGAYADGAPPAQPRFSPSDEPRSSRASAGRACGTTGSVATPWALRVSIASAAHTSSRRPRRIHRSDVMRSLP